MHRRRFIELASISGLSLQPIRMTYPLRKRPRFQTYPFSLGVASGDPTASGVVLWTRVAPDPLSGEALPPERVAVQWEVGADETFTRVVRRGTADATPELAHSVHVDVDGLEPDRWYWYRFIVGGDSSQVGRTRTTPDPRTLPERLDFAFVSCQHYEQGLFTGFEYLAQEEIDLVYHLGDYIYEGPGQPDRVRTHIGGELETLDDYRTRYAQYKSDPQLQAAHAAFPWLVTWDDHEVDNNYAGTISENEDPIDAFLIRRAVAYQAYYEHMPIRRLDSPGTPDMRIYRQSTFGALAQSFVLDTRQYRTDQPCGDRNKPPCSGALDPAATILGDDQERWLRRGLEQSSARWNILAQQVMMAHVDRRAGEGELYSMDQWSGYAVARNRLLRFLHEASIANPIVLTGDIHTNWVNDLKIDFADPDSPTVGTEFVGTSISSSGDGFTSTPRTDSYLSENPFLKFFNGQRGYVRCEVTPQQWLSHYRAMEYVTRPGSPISTIASFLVENGRPGTIRV